MTPQELVWWLGALIALAGAVKGFLFLLEEGRRAGSRIIGWFDEKRRVRKLMAQLTDDEGWPNGSNSIIHSHNALYEKLGAISITLDNLAETVENYILTEGRRPNGDL